QEAQNVQSVNARHHQIEENGSVIVVGELFDGFETIARGVHFELLPPQDGLDHDANTLIVIDDQDFFGTFSQRGKPPGSPRFEQVASQNRQWNQEPPLTSMVTPLR